MSELVELKTAELTGQALNWAVAKATGAGDLKATDSGSVCCIYEIPCGSGCWTNYYEPSTDWSHGGPLIIRFNIEFTILSCNGSASVTAIDAAVMDFVKKTSTSRAGETHLIAACRAIVASVLGPVVSVPKELV